MQEGSTTLRVDKPSFTEKDDNKGKLQEKTEKDHHNNLKLGHSDRASFGTLTATVPISCAVCYL